MNRIKEVEDVRLLKLRNPWGYVRLSLHFYTTDFATLALAFVRFFYNSFGEWNGDWVSCGLKMMRRAYSLDRMPAEHIILLPSSGVHIKTCRNTARQRESVIT